MTRTLLARGRAVRALVAPGASSRNLDGLDIELVTADVRSPEAVRAAMVGCNVVYHLAAIYRCGCRTTG